MNDDPNSSLYVKGLKQEIDVPRELLYPDLSERIICLGILATVLLQCIEHFERLYKCKEKLYEWIISSIVELPFMNSSPLFFSFRVISLK